MPYCNKCKHIVGWVEASGLCPKHDRIKNSTEVPTKPGYYKFVKINEEYRWIEVVSFCGNHSELVDGGEIAEAAGSIFLYDDFWRMESWHSSTLNISCKGNEDEEITALLGKPIKEHY